MGAICPCFSNKSEYTYTPVPTNERSPLLRDEGSARPRGSSYSEGVTSARTNRQSFEENKTGEVDLRKITVGDVGITHLDKQFKDHAALFNEHVDKYDQLRDIKARMMRAYDDIGATPSTLAHVFSMVKEELNEEAKNSLGVTRKQRFCMEITFSAKYVSEKGVAIFDNFNRANRLVKDLIEKGPLLVQTVTLVVDNEEHAKRDVTVYYSELERKEQGPEKLKICINNTAEMRRVAPAVTFIGKEAARIFDALKIAAEVLFKSQD